MNINRKWVTYNEENKTIALLVLSDVCSRVKSKHADDSRRETYHKKNV